MFLWLNDDIMSIYVFIYKNEINTFSIFLSLDPAFSKIFTANSLSSLSTDMVWQEANPPAPRGAPKW